MCFPITTRLQQLHLILTSPEAAFNLELENSAYHIELALQHLTTSFLAGVRAQNKSAWRAQFAPLVPRLGWHAMLSLVLVL